MKDIHGPILHILTSKKWYFLAVARKKIPCRAVARDPAACQANVCASLPTAQRYVIDEWQPCASFAFTLQTSTTSSSTTCFQYEFLRRRPRVTDSNNGGLRGLVTGNTSRMCVRTSQTPEHCLQQLRDAGTSTYVNIYTRIHVSQTGQVLDIHAVYTCIHITHMHEGNRQRHAGIWESKGKTKTRVESSWMSHKSCIESTAVHSFLASVPEKHTLVSVGINT